VPLAVILGANGFIGGHIAAELGRLPGFDVVGGGLGTPLPDLERRWLDVDLLAEDNRLAAELRALKPAVLVNCTGASVGSAADLVRLNVLVTARLLEALAQSGLPTRLVHLGSAAEYGDGPAGRPVLETACAAPISPYGITKLAATKLVLEAADRGREALVLRVFNALGPAMATNSLPGAALARLTEAVAQGTPRIELGPLGSVRDFVDVRDIAAAVGAAASTPGLTAQLINVGSGTGHSARELVEALARRVGFAGEIAEVSAGSPRSAAVAWQVADVSRAQDVLGWRAAHDLQSSIELMTQTSADSGDMVAGRRASDGN
jgi:NDP-hexose 4-ketoreductase